MHTKWMLSHLTSSLAALLVLAFCPSAPAAEDGGLLFYSGGGNLLSPAALNPLIQPTGYKALDSWSWGQGIGMYGVFKRVMIGLEYQSLFGQLTRNGQEAMKLDGSYSLLQAGYMVVATPAFQVYPYLGIGRGSMNLRSSQALNSLLSVSQGSNQNLNSLTAGNWLLDLGLGANLILPMTPGNTSDARGPALALRAGYLLPLGNSEWSANELPVTGGPLMSPGGLYFRLMLGFGGLQ